MAVSVSTKPRLSIGSTTRLFEHPIFESTATPNTASRPTGGGLSCPNPWVWPGIAWMVITTDVTRNRPRASAAH